MKLDLGAKMTGVVVGVMLGVAAVLLTVTTVLEEQRIAESMEQRVNAVSEAILQAALARLGERSDAFEGLQPLAARLGTLEGIAWMEVIDGEGRIVAHSDAALVGALAPADDRERATRALAEGRPLRRTLPDGSTAQLLPVALPHAETDGAEQAVLEVVLTGPWTAGLAIDEAAEAGSGAAPIDPITQAVEGAVRATLEHERIHGRELQNMADRLVALPSLSRVDVLDSRGRIVARASSPASPEVKDLDLLDPARRVLERGEVVDLPMTEAQRRQRFLPIDRRTDGGEVERLGVVAMVFDDGALREVTRAHRRQLLAILFGIVVAVGLVSIGTLRAIVGRPIEKLAAATAAVADGELTTVVPVESEDEVGQLARSFNRMVRALGEQTVSRDYFERVLHGIREGVIATDSEGCIVFANRAAASLFQRPAASLVGLPLGAILVTRPSDAQISDREVPRFRETSLTQADGSHVPVLVSSTSIDGASRRGTVWVIEDLSERRDLEEQLRHSQKMEAVGRLAGGIAHDYNNYLTVISGYAEVLLRMTPEGDRTRAFAQQIFDAAESSAELTRRLLEFGRRQPVQPVPIEIGAQVSRMHDVLARVLGERIRIETSLEDGGATVVMDPAQLEQVILNLVVNARDAMDDGGCLRVTTRACEVDEELAQRHPGLSPGPHVVLSVQDDGVGIEPEIRARIFEPFFTTKAPGQGTGLGLPSVYGIVTRAGGMIEVESAPGEGTTFHVYLPRVEGAAQPVGAATSASTPVGETDGAATVLVVEDQAMVRSLARDLLGRAGYRVVVASSAEEAIATVGEDAREVDLLLTDVVMPGMGGRELARRLLARRPELPVIYMSGYDEVRAEGRESKLGEVWLQKPFRSQHLLDAVRSVLGAMPSVPE